MTSNTTPSGIALSSRNLNTDYVPFDQDDSTELSTVTGSSSDAWWIQYCFKEAVKVNSFSLYSSYGRIQSFRLLASNNGADFTTVFTGNHNASTIKQTYTITNSEKYKYWRLKVDSATANPLFGSVQLYG